MLNSILTTPAQLSGLLICLFCALALGILTSLVFSFKHTLSSSFAVTLAILPVAMTMVVMMVNGNFGIAIAVAGSFTLVRFRSIAGTGREISAVFTVMTLGVILGMGYIGISLIFFAVVAALVLALSAIGFGEKKSSKCLRITIPENYDYSGLFDEIFAKYSVKAEMTRIKTTNMGSLIDVFYNISFAGSMLPKAMIDEIRTKNANLSISVSPIEADRSSL